MSLRICNFIRRNYTGITLKYLSAQNEIQPLHKIIWNEPIVLLLQLFQEQEIQLMRLLQKNKLINHFSNDEVLVDEHEKEASEELFWINVFLKGLICKDLISYGLEYLCFQFYFFVKVLQLLNYLQVLTSEVWCIFEEHLEAGLLLIRLINVDEAAAVVWRGSVEGEGFLAGIASMVLYHFGFIYDAQSIAVFVNVLDLGFDQPDYAQDQTVTL